MEKLSEPNAPLPLDTVVANTSTTEFVLVRAHSKCLCLFSSYFKIEEKLLQVQEAI
jgi:hypothetical protein